MKNFDITTSTIRNTLWNTAIMVFLYLVFNIFMLGLLHYILDENLNKKLAHETEHLEKAFKIVNGEFKIVNNSELEERDLNKVTDDPFYLQIYSLNGMIWLQSKSMKGIVLPIDFPKTDKKTYFKDLKSNKEHIRIAYTKMYNKNGKVAGIMQLGTSDSLLNEFIRKTIFFNVVSFPIVLLLIFAVSIFLAKKSYMPINKIINLANEISATNLNKRLEYYADPDDELGRLKDTLNNLFDRLEKQINEISQFSDNASHQLMTPLTAMNTELEYILKKDYPSNEYKKSLLLLKRQTQRMINVVKALLIIAEDKNKIAEEKSIFNVSKLMSQELSKLYDKKNIYYNIENNIYLKGNSEYLFIAIENLVDNAIKYSEKNSVINIKLFKKANNIIVSVEDFGKGILDDEKERIFERFYRGKSSEEVGVKGYGLGLSLVQSIINSMGGKVIIDNKRVIGTKFIIKLPVVNMQ